MIRTRRTLCLLAALAAAWAGASRGVPPCAAQEEEPAEAAPGAVPSRVQGELEYVWLEGEDAAEHDFARHGWYDRVDKTVLSGEEWLSHYDAERPGRAVFAFTVEKGGRYAWWCRMDVAQVAVRYSLDGGNAGIIPVGDNVRDMVDMSDATGRRVLGWVAAGVLDLTAGEHTLTLTANSRVAHHGAVDCMALVNFAWEPKGTETPGDMLEREAEFLALVAKLKDPEPMNRLAAVEGLAGLDHPRVLEALARATRDPDVQKEAVAAIGASDDPRVVKVLVAVLAQGGAGARATAAELLGGKGGERAGTALIRALRDRSDEVRAAAAAALGELEVVAAAEHLVRRLGDGQPSVRNNAVGALTAIGMPAAEDLIAALDRDWPGRWPAAYVLLGLREPEPHMAVVELMKKRKRELERVKENYRDCIRRGEPGTEYILLLALEAHGDAGMGTAFLNCGNAVLSDGAERWAGRHGHDVLRLPGGGGKSLTWGEK